MVPLFLPFGSSSATPTHFPAIEIDFSFVDHQIFVKVKIFIGKKTNMMTHQQTMLIQCIGLFL